MKKQKELKAKEDLPILKKAFKKEIAKEKKRQEFLKKIRERY
jgi:hypothetical protein